MPPSGSSFFIQGPFGGRGNFEVVVPRQGGGIAHYTRDNDSPALPWTGPRLPFGSQEEVTEVCIVASRRGGESRLEVLFLAGGRLGHNWRLEASGRWQSVTWLPGPAAASGSPGFIQGSFGSEGNFEVVAPLAGGGMAHWFRNNDLSGTPWRGPFPFGAGPIAAVGLAQSNLGAPGNLEVVARVGRRLAHYFRDGSGWHGPHLFARGVTGTPCLIQSAIGDPGNFEVVAPLVQGGIGHWWRDNGRPSPAWSGPTVFGADRAAAVGLVQSRFGAAGNLEVVARLEGRLAHFFRDATGVWHGPTVFGVEPACEPARGGRAAIPYRSGVVGVHLGLMHTGKVVLFGFADDSDHHGESRVLDPASGHLEPAPPPGHAAPNLFCSGHTFLASGELLVVGGHHESRFGVHTFDPTHQAWTARPPMAEGRWYPTCVALPDGRALVLSGTRESGPVSLTSPVNHTLQIFDPASGMGPPEALPTPFSRFFPGFFSTIDLYPFVYVLPDGRLAVHSRNTTRFYHPPAPGSAGSWNPAQHRTKFPTSRSYPYQGTSVLLPLLPGTSPPYRARLMVIGGAGSESADEFTPATATCEILDLGAPRPQWVETAPMASPRVMADAVLLPNGHVLVVGGSASGRADSAAEPVLDVEWFDPASRKWATLCPLRVPRLYHSTALLLADATVLVAGKDGLFQPPAYRYPEHRCEVVSPPYLFAGPRPRITLAPTTAAYGAALLIRTPDAAAVAAVALIRPGSVTHSFNFDQRYVGLEFAREGTRIVAQAPPGPSLAQPGRYLLFLVDAAGVPSVAKWLALG